MAELTLDRLEREGAIPLSDVPEVVRGICPGISPHRTTVLCWVARGINGVRLEAWRVGRRRYTTRAALSRFIDGLSESPAGAEVRRRAERSSRRAELADRLG